MKQSIDRRVWEQGHSLLITLPQYYCVQLGIEAGDYLKCTLIDGRGIMVELMEARDKGAPRDVEPMIV